MKNQYIGDIGDYGKYGLLRFIAERGIKVGVNWYLTKNDGSSDGKITNYLNNPKEADYNGEIFGALKKVADRQDKSVYDIEKADLIPDARYYHEILSNDAADAHSREIHRRLWEKNALAYLEDGELIFADPDNGIGYGKKPGRKGSEKYVLPEEIAAYYQRGQNVVFYCHKGRRKADAWERAKVGIRDYLPDAKIIVLTFHRGTQRSYIFALHPEEYDRYQLILDDFLKSKWGKLFTREPVADPVH